MNILISPDQSIIKNPIDRHQVTFFVTTISAREKTCVFKALITYLAGKKIHCLYIFYNRKSIV